MFLRARLPRVRGQVLPGHGVHGAAQGAAVPGGEQAPRSAVPYEFPADGDVCGDDGEAAAHGLNLHEAEALAPGGEEQNGVFGVFPLHGCVAAVQANAGLQAVFPDEFLHPRAQGAVSVHVQVPFPVIPAEFPERLQGQVRPLVGGQGAREDERF